MTPMRDALLPIALLLCALSLWVSGAVAQEQASAERPAPNLDQPTQTLHGLAMHGQAKYGPGFTHFEYVNPAAPKGGELYLSTFGGFDSLNPFITSGNPAPGLGLTFDTLMYNSADEAFTEYGLVAKTITVPEDRSWVEFELRPEARFHDGSPITADDIIFSMEILQTQAQPFYRQYYGDVLYGEPVGENGVRFVFGVSGNRELPLIVGQMPIMSRAYWQERDFSRATTEPILGSGPYRITDVDPNQRLTLTRVADYWAEALPARVGYNNFDRIHYLSYRDREIERQALFAGDIDVFQENTAKDWAVSYETSPAVRDGRILKQEIPHEIPQGMQGIVFNLRREKFQDIRVRRALTLLFDWSAINDEVAYGAYTRSLSYFSNSELAASGLPSQAELTLLEPLRGQIPDTVFTEVFTLPGDTDAEQERALLRQAHELLNAAGWEVRDGQRVNAKTGAPMTIEFLNVQGAMDRWINPLRRQLDRLGIETSLRQVDVSLYLTRRREFDFDMTVSGFGQSLSPGNEQREFWGSDSAAREGSRNLAGIANPAIDRLIDHIILAEDREALITAVKALDRVLLHSYLMIPMHHIAAHRIAHWHYIERPALPPKYSLGMMTWWERPGGRDAN